MLDGLLRGGLPLGGITELAGRSSVGKTQLALQLCLAVQLPRRLGGLEAGECRPRAGVCVCVWPLPVVAGTGLAPAVCLSLPVAVRCLQEEWPALPHGGPWAAAPGPGGAHTSLWLTAPGSTGAVYVCTEDAFPDRRLQQLMAQQRRLRTDAPGHQLEEIRFGDHIFIEHVADVVSVCQRQPG